MNPITQITPQDAYARLQAGAILLDIRESDELVEIQADVPEMLHVPMSDFQNRIQHIPKERDLITICRSGGRSLVATQLLVAHGYAQIMNLSGGLIAWQEAGLPII